MYHLPYTFIFNRYGAIRTFLRDFNDGAPLHVLHGVINPGAEHISVHAGFDERRVHDPRGARSQYDDALRTNRSVTLDLEHYD